MKADCLLLALAALLTGCDIDFVAVGPTGAEGAFSLSLQEEGDSLVVRIDGRVDTGESVMGDAGHVGTDSLHVGSLHLSPVDRVGDAFLYQESAQGEGADALLQLMGSGPVEFPVVRGYGTPALHDVNWARRKGPRTFTWDGGAALKLPVEVVGSALDQRWTVQVVGDLGTQVSIFQPGPLPDTVAIPTTVLGPCRPEVFEVHVGMIGFSRVEGAGYKTLTSSFSNVDWVITRTCP